jgi:hypothetical protein
MVSAIPGIYTSKTFSPPKGATVSDEERTAEEGTEHEETIQDLDVSEDAAEDVKGGARSAPEQKYSAK